MKITAPSEMSLLDLMRTAFPDSSVTKLKKVIQCGCVRHKGAVVKHPELVLAKGDTVDYTRYEAKRTFRERTSVPVLYEDGTIIVSFKPSGTPLAGKSIGGVRSLNNSLNADLSRVGKSSVAVTPVMYLRNDENGICVFCKNPALRDALAETCAKAEKHFRVWVAGQPQDPQGTFRAYASLNPRGFLHHWVEQPDDTTVECRMSYTVLHTERDIALLDVRMVQHFENQLCMMLMQCGFPVLGDKRNKQYRVDYPYPYAFNYRVDITNPRTRKTLTLSTSIPAFFDEKNEKNNGKMPSEE